MALRSLLFVPGDSPRKVERAFASVADCIILDLEDSIAASKKENARQLVAEVLKRPRACAVAVRVNGQDTEWYRHDLLALVDGAPDYVVLPKCRNVADIVRIDHELAILEARAGLAVGSTKLLPLVTESASAAAELDYGRAPPRTAALCFAAEDLSSDLGIDARNELGELAPPLAQVRTATLLAARAAGLPALDTPFPDFRRLDPFAAEVYSAVSQGFSGKLCIHPDQIERVNSAFTPSAERLRWADAVTAAFRADPAAGVVGIEGAMVDKAHLRLAEQLRARVAT